MKILFLYAELADYTIACLKALKKRDVEIMVLHFPVNPEAPFRFDFSEIGQFKCVNDFSSYQHFIQAIRKFDPAVIVCGGWQNKWYLRACFRFRSRLNILTLDNHWNNSLQQKILRILSPFTLKFLFKKLWVPGEHQIQYAEKLSFRRDQIIEGFYSCDTDRFNQLYDKNRAAKEQQFPKKILCVARYIPVKNYPFLWKAFIRFREQYGSDWELWCAGTGEQFGERIEHPAIKHLGFVQKEEWEKVIANTGVFVLASLSEPWGVVVQEFAAAGYPLLLSSEVGAASGFLNADNGFSFHPEKEEELVQLFAKIAGMTDAELNRMGNNSHKYAQRITPHKWADALLKAVAGNASGSVSRLHSR